LGRFLNRTIEKGLSRRYRRLQWSVENPFRAQEKILNYLILKLKSTKYANVISRKSIKNASDFFSLIPVSDYESLKPFIQQALKGENHILWPGRVRWFAKSSGTTSDKSKFIPVSRQTLKDCHYKAGRDMLAVFVKNYPETSIFYGSGLIIGGSTQLNREYEKSVTGDISAILSENLPLWTKFWQNPGKRILQIADWEEKINVMAREMPAKNITHITGVPTWTCVLFDKILQNTGAANIHEIWPNLELFIHGGVSFSPYRQLFGNYLPGSQIKYLETYNASEGFFGFQDDPSRNDFLLLLNHGIFYEFIPTDGLSQNHHETIGLSEVKTGINYAMVISTNSGLWRYLIGDTIVFTSIHPYRFILSGRTKHFINAFGEELIIDNAEKAIAYACRKTSAIIRDYTAGPVFLSRNRSGAHEWLIEFQKEPDDLELFISFLDEKLKELNSDYEAKRSGDLALGRPVVRVMPEGTFYNWLKNKGKLGGQHKVPRLSNNRLLIEEILGISGQ